MNDAGRGLHRDRLRRVLSEHADGSALARWSPRRRPQRQSTGPRRSWMRGADLGTSSFSPHRFASRRMFPLPPALSYGCRDRVLHLSGERHVRSGTDHPNKDFEQTSTSRLRTSSRGRAHRRGRRNSSSRHRSSITDGEAPQEASTSSSSTAPPIQTSLDGASKMAAQGSSRRTARASACRPGTSGSCRCSLVNATRTDRSARRLLVRQVARAPRSPAPSSAMDATEVEPYIRRPHRTRPQPRSETATARRGERARIPR